MAKGWTFVSVVFLIEAALVVLLYQLGLIEDIGFWFWVRFVLIFALGFFIGLVARGFEEKEKPRNVRDNGR